MMGSCDTEFRDSPIDESIAELATRRWGSDGGSTCLWRVHLVPKPLLLFFLLPDSKVSSYSLLPWYPTYHRSRSTHPRGQEPKPLIINPNQNPLLCADIVSYFVSDRVVTFFKFYFAVNKFWSSLFTLGGRGNIWPFVSCYAVQADPELVCSIAVPYQVLGLQAGMATPY